MASQEGVRSVSAPYVRRGLSARQTPHRLPEMIDASTRKPCRSMCPEIPRNWTACCCGSMAHRPSVPQSKGCSKYFAASAWCPPPAASASADHSIDVIAEVIHLPRNGAPRSQICRGQNVTRFPRPDLLMAAWVSAELLWVAAAVLMGTMHPLYPLAPPLEFPDALIQAHAGGAELVGIHYCVQSAHLR